MIIVSHFVFKISAVFYLLGLAASFADPKMSRLARLALIFAVLANAAAVAMRYYYAWPMLPMYLGPAATALFLGTVAIFADNGERKASAKRLLLLLTALLAATAALFPKDFYLPFLKSKTILSHLFFIFGVAGKGCFLTGSIWAAVGLFSKQGFGENGPRRSPTDRAFRWTVWGFAFWTLSMFSGEMWSYMGWGAPVVWDEPAIATSMATWFFYVCLMHLHLTRTWSARGRAIYAAAGALVVFCLNFLPELGPFRRPF